MQAGVKVAVRRPENVRLGANGASERPQLRFSRSSPSLPSAGQRNEAGAELVRARLTSSRAYRAPASACAPRSCVARVSSPILRPMSVPTTVENR